MQGSFRSAGDVSIDDFYYDNDGGALKDSGDGTLSIGTEHAEQSDELDVPGPDDVGAWSGDCPGR